MSSTQIWIFEKEKKGWNTANRSSPNLTVLFLYSTNLRKLSSSTAFLASSTVYKLSFGLVFSEAMTKSVFILSKSSDLRCLNSYFNSHSSTQIWRFAYEKQDLDTVALKSKLNSPIFTYYAQLGVMRTLFFAFRTLPSKTVLTPNWLPMVRTSIFLFLNAKEDVRAMTFKPFTVVRALIISSVIPSLKYSFSGSELILTKGRTTMDLLDVDMGR